MLVHCITMIIINHETQSKRPLNLQYYSCFRKKDSLLFRVLFHLTESFGNFTFEMNLFKTGDFREHYTEYPVGPVDVGTDIFLQVAVKSNDTGVIVFVDECKATATPNYDDEMQFVFLEDG